MITDRLRYIWRSFITRRVNHLSISAYVSNDTVLEGSNFIGPTCRIYSSSLGRYSYINQGSHVNLTTVGRYSCIGPDVLCGLGSHPTDRISMHRMFYAGSFLDWSKFRGSNDFPEFKRIAIGHDVWIGARSMIMDGVTIEDGAVIAGGSVVVKDVPAYSVVGGAPARVLKMRFPDEIKAEIQKSQWWNLEPELLASLSKMDHFNNVLREVRDVESIMADIEVARVRLAANTFSST